MKTVIIGLDGADWRYIKPYIDELPTFKKLIENGTHGNLTSTIPPITCPAWPCFSSGQNPGKVGVFDLTTFDEKSKQIKVVSSKVIKNKKIWKYLNENGATTSIIGVPGTYPPEQVDGIMISGFMTPSKDVDYTYPAELKKEIADIFEPGGRNVQIKLSEREAHWKDQMEKLEKSKMLAKKLLSEKKSDFFIFVFQGTDAMQHLFLTKPVAEDIIVRFYKEVDKMLAEMLELVDKDTVVMLMSDHGGEAWDQEKPVKVFHVYEWMRQEGYLKEKGKRLFNINKAKIYYFLLDKFKMDIRKVIPYSIKKKIIHPYQSVDWSNTKAFVNVYQQRWGGIRITDKQNFNQLRSEIISKLENLKDEDEKVIEKIWIKEELYGPDTVEGTPDIIFQTNMNYSVFNLRSNSLFTNKTNVYGIHGQDGIFLASGPNIKKSQEIKDAKLIDITPTILAMYGIPVPTIMDGRPLLEIFEQPPAVKKYSAEKARIQEKLKKLKL